MTVVRVGDVRVRVLERLVGVRVRMRLGDACFVRVQVVGVVHVQVIVLERLVGVQVRVPCPQQARDPQRHQHRGGEIQGRGSVPEQRHRGQRARERRCREKNCA